MVPRTAFRRATVVIFFIALGAFAAPTASASARFHVECPFHHFNGDDPIVYPGVAAPGSEPPARVLREQVDQLVLDLPIASPRRHELRPSRRQGGLLVPRRLQERPAGQADGRRFLLPGEDRAARAPFARFRKVSRSSPETRKRPAPRARRSSAGRASGARAPPEPTMRDCGNADVKFLVHFPSCWDGRHKDSADHKSHMHYSIKKNGRRACPKSHPVPVPELSYSIRLPFHDGRHVHLSSGPFYTMHADFWNAWKQRELRRWWTSASMPGSNARPLRRDGQRPAPHLGALAGGRPGLVVGTGSVGSPSLVEVATHASSAPFTGVGTRSSERRIISR